MRNRKAVEDTQDMAVVMYYYAFLNANDVVEMVIGLPSVITDPQYISIPTNDQSLVGKKYNRVTGEFEDVMFYYAILDEKDLVIEVVALEAEVMDEKKILIPTYDQSLVGMWYNRQTGKFTEPPIHILAKMNTGEINTLNAAGNPEDKWLDTKLKELDSKFTEMNSKIAAVADGSFGGYKCRFRLRDNQETTAEWENGKRLTFSFDTGIPGYFPKMIRLESEKNQVDVLIADLYISRNADGTTKNAYVDKKYTGIPITGIVSESAPFEILNIEASDSGVMEMGYTGGRYFDEGASYFMQTIELPRFGYVAVGKFTYDENSISFEIMVSDDVVGAYTSMDLWGYVY